MDSFWRCEVCNFESPNILEKCAFCNTPKGGDVKFTFELTFRYSDPIVETGETREVALEKAHAQAEAKRRALNERFTNVEVTVS